MKNSDLRVSRLCMGGCPMGGHGWGIVQEKDLIDAVHAALDQGLNFFDTADTYGLGQSERTLSRGLEGRRDQAVIASKFGVRVENGHTFYDNSPQWIRTACENSLRRLNTDYIDLYQIHYRDGRTPLGEVVDALEQLRWEGKIRYFGLSNLDMRDFEELEEYRGRFVSLQNQYSLACRDHEAQTMELCRKLDLSPLTWGSLGQGILTGKYDATASFTSDDRRSRAVYTNFHGKKLLKNLEIVAAMRPMAARYGKPLSALAVRFILDYLNDSVVLCGVKRPDQIRSNAESLGWHLRQRDIDYLEFFSR